MDTIINEKRIVDASRTVGNITYTYRYIVENSILQELKCSINKMVTQLIMRADGNEEVSSMQSFGMISYSGGVTNSSIPEGENSNAHISEFDDILTTVNATITA